MLTLVIASLLIGWLIGGLGNWAADQLPHLPGTALTPAWRHPQRYWWRPGPMVVDQATDDADGKPPRRWRAPLLLVTMALCFAYTAIRLTPRGDLTWQLGQMGLLLVAWLYVAFLLVVLVIDLEQRRVLNIMLIPALILVGVGSLLPGTPTLINALLGGAFGFGLFLALYIIGRGRLGAGDVKLAGVIGLMVGYPAVWTALVLGVVLGGVAALVLLASRSASLRSTMAYAPYLAIGAIITIWRTWGAAGGL